MELADENDLWPRLFESLKEKFGDNLDCAMNPIRRRKTPDERALWISGTQDLTSNDFEKLSSIPELRGKMMSWRTIANWTAECNAGIWDLGLQETPSQGLSIDSTSFAAFILVNSWDDIFETDESDDGELGNMAVEAEVIEEVEEVEEVEIEAPNTTVSTSTRTNNSSRDVYSPKPLQTRFSLDPHSTVPMLQKDYRVVDEKELSGKTVHRMTIVGTMDYAKKPSVMLAGLQLNHPKLNQFSSNNYHIGTCYIGEENPALFQENLASYFSFLNCAEELIYLESDSGGDPIPIILSKESLNDWSCVATLLGIDAEGCCFCDGNTERPTCESYRLNLGNVQHDFYATFDLNDCVSQHFPASLLKMQLIKIRIDFALHGFKALITNFFNTMLSSFQASEDELKKKVGASEFDRRETNFLKIMWELRSNFNMKSGLVNGSFSFSGVEVKKLTSTSLGKRLIEALCPRADTMIIYDSIIRLFRLIATKRDKKVGDESYVSNVKSLGETLTMNWKKRYGPDSIGKKVYLHLITHIWELEKFCLANNLETIDSYSMQGREHANKIIGAYTLRHNISDSSEKRGRKREGQKEEEERIREHMAIFNAERRRIITHKVSMPGSTKEKIIQLAPQIGLSKKSEKKETLKEQVINFVVKRDSILEKKNFVPLQERVTRTKCYKILTRCYRRLLFRSIVPEIESCTQY